MDLREAAAPPFLAAAIAARKKQKPGRLLFDIRQSLLKRDGVKKPSHGKSPKLVPPTRALVVDRKRKVSGFSTCMLTFKEISSKEVPWSEGVPL